MFLTKEHGFRYIKNRDEAHVFTDKNDRIFCVKTRRPVNFGSTADAARDFVEKLSAEYHESPGCNVYEVDTRAQRRSHKSACVSFGYTLGPGSTVRSLRVNTRHSSSFL